MPKIHFSDPAQDGDAAVAPNAAQAATAVRRPNIFQGRPDSIADYAKFPDWDILPPEGAIINPRLKK